MIRFCRFETREAEGSDLAALWRQSDVRDVDDLALRQSDKNLVDLWSSGINFVLTSVCTQFS